MRSPMRVVPLAVIVCLFVALPSFARLAFNPVSLKAEPAKAEISPDSPVATITLTLDPVPSGAAAADIYAGDSDFAREDFVARMEAGTGWSTTIPIAVAGTHKFKVVVFNSNGDPTNESRAPAVVTITSDFKTRDNGITVGRVKQFDDRALGVMLRDVEQALANQRFLSFTGVSEAVGRFQGATAERSFFGVSATGPGTPAIEETSGSKDITKSPKSSIEVIKDGTGTKTTTKDEAGTAETEDTSGRKVTQAAVNASAPQVPSAGTAAFNLQPTFGVSAQDLLAEHTELAYQAINLRLLLQRAVTDRLLTTHGDFAARSQPVIGFNISLDPRPRFKDAIAEVIVSAIPYKGTYRREAPEIVALLPKEKTYNVATITNRTKAASLGAVVQMVNVGVTASGSRETYFIVKDTDTVALEKVPVKSIRTEPPVSVDFAWQFRPVLDRRLVSPGSRQVFAVLALPATHDETWEGILHVRTRWRAYDRKTKSAGWVILGSESWQEPYRIRIAPVDAQVQATAARIRDIQWQDNGAGKAVVTMDGSFPANTRFAVADTFIDRADNGMLLQSDRQMIVAVPFEKLFVAPPVLIDSFGIPTVVRHPKAELSQPFKVKVETPAAPADTATLKLAVTLTDPAAVVTGTAVERKGGPVTLQNPVVLIGSRVFSLRNDGMTITAGEVDANGIQTKPIVIELTVDTALAKEAARLKLVDLFYGNGQAAEAPIKFGTVENPVISELQILTVDGANVVFGLVGQNLKNAEELRVTVGDQTYPLTPASKTLVVFGVPVTTAETARRAVVFRKGAEPKILAIPALRLDDPKIVHDRIREGEQRRLRLQGPHLAQVREIRYNGLKLAFTPDGDDARTIYLHHSPELMGSSGEKEVQLVTSTGAVLPARIFIDAKKD